MANSSVSSTTGTTIKFTPTAGSAQGVTTNVVEDESQKTSFGNNTSTTNSNDYFGISKKPIFGRNTFENANKFLQHTTEPLFTNLQQASGNNTITTQSNFGNTFGQSRGFGTTTNSSQNTIFNKSLPTTQSSINKSPSGNKFESNTITTLSNFGNTFGQPRRLGTTTNSPQSTTFNKSLATTQSSSNTISFGNVLANNTTTTQSNFGDTIGQLRGFSTTINSPQNTIFNKSLPTTQSSINKSPIGKFENNTITTQSNGDTIGQSTGFGTTTNSPQSTTFNKLLATTQSSSNSFGSVFANNTITTQSNFGDTFGQRKSFRTTRNSPQSKTFNKSLTTTHSSFSTASFGSLFGNNTTTTQSNFGNTFGQPKSFDTTTNSPQSITFNKPLAKNTQSSFSRAPFGSLFENSTTTTQSNFGNTFGQQRSFGTTTNSTQSTTFNKSLATTQSSSNTIPFGNVFANNIITTQSNFGDTFGQSKGFGTTTNSPQSITFNKSLASNRFDATDATTLLQSTYKPLTTPSGCKFNPISSNPIMQLTFNIYGQSVNNNQLILPTSSSTHQINISTPSLQSDTAYTECLLNLESLQVNITINPANKKISIKEPTLCADTTTESEVLLNSIDNIETCGVKSTRSDYYTIPPLNSLHLFKNKNGTCNIKGFIIGRFGYGHVCFPDIIDVTNLDIDKDVHINLKNICIYSDDDKPLLGEGLNRKAVVTLDKVYRDKKEVEADPETMMAEIFAEICKRGKTSFVEYRPASGTWVFEVDHF